MQVATDWLGREYRAGDYILYAVKSGHAVQLRLAQVVAFETTRVDGSPLSKYDCDQDFRVIARYLDKSSRWERYTWSHSKSTTRLKITKNITKIDWSPND